MCFNEKNLWCSYITVHTQGGDLSDYLIKKNVTDIRLEILWFQDTECLTFFLNIFNMV